MPDIAGYSDLPPAVGAAETASEPGRDSLWQGYTGPHAQADTSPAQATSSLTCVHSRRPVTEPATNVLMRLREDLTSFRLRPGERLIEEELSQRYGVSRTPVREALRVLQQQGLVVEDSRRRRSVPHFDIAAFEDIYRVRAGLERLAVLQACERATDSAIADLAGSWDVTRDEDESIEYYRSDERFHSGIARLSRNEFLIDALARVDDRIRIIRLVDFTSPDRVARTRNEHTEILNAMLAGNDEAASRLVGEHVDEAMTNVRELVTRALAKIMLEG